MWDIIIHCTNLYRDIFKAYFIVNDIDYTEKEDGLVFYADSVEKFFNIVSGLNEFYHSHSKRGMETLHFAVSVDEMGTYCITPVRFAEE